MTLRPESVGSGFAFAASRSERIWRIPASVSPFSGHPAPAWQSSTYARRAFSKPTACCSEISSGSSEVSIAPSSTMRPTLSGNSPAYVAPSCVPYE